MAPTDRDMIIALAREQGISQSDLVMRAVRALLGRPEGIEERVARLEAISPALRGFRR
jgi:hypothetical protein